MSWISDTKYELSKLDLSKKSLRKFGLTIGIIFIAIAIWLLLENIVQILSISLLFIGGSLFVFGLLNPIMLRKIYLIWMGIALAMGWVVSRILLSFIFLFILIPVGFIAKVFRKDFLYLPKFRQGKSHWHKKNNTTINYEKMY